MIENYIILHILPLAILIVLFLPLVQKNCNYSGISSFPLRILLGRE